MCPFSINLAIPSLSACADNLMTSFKVCAESKYTVPTTRVSAKTGSDAANNAMNKNVMHHAAQHLVDDRLTRMNLAAYATVIRFQGTRMTVAYAAKFIRVSQSSTRC